LQRTGRAQIHGLRAAMLNSLAAQPIVTTTGQASGRSFGAM
jgi:hypothetical protein